MYRLKTNINMLKAYYYYKRVENNKNYRYHLMPILKTKNKSIFLFKSENMLRGGNARKIKIVNALYICKKSV